MPQPIFSRVGTEDRIHLPAFIAALGNFSAALKDMDATISEHPKGSVFWEVTSLQKNSAPVVGVTPTPRKPALPDRTLNSWDVSGNRDGYRRPKLT